VTPRTRLACVLVSPLVWFAVGGAFYLAVPLVVPAIPPQFENAALYRPWAGWTSTYMALHPLWYAPLFALAYLWLRGRGLFSGLDGGLAYGLAAFALGGLPGFALSFASFQMSPEVLACWLLQSVCQHALTGTAIGAVAGRD